MEQKKMFWVKLKEFVVDARRDYIEIDRIMQRNRDEQIINYILSIRTVWASSVVEIIALNLESTESRINRRTYIYVWMVKLQRNSTQSSRECMQIHEMC